MANPLTRYLNSGSVQAAVQAGVEKALSTERPPAYETTTLPELPLGQMVWQPHDADYALLYSVYKLNADVSGCVHKRAGGATGAGWRITTMGEDAKLTPKLEQHHSMVEELQSLLDF